VCVCEDVCECVYVRVKDVCVCMCVQDVCVCVCVCVCTRRATPRQARRVPPRARLCVRVCVCVCKGRVRVCVCVCVSKEREGEREKERERKCAFTRLVIRRQARRVPLRLASPPSMPTPAFKVDVRLPGTENSSSHGAVRRHLLDCNEACLSLALSRRPTLSLSHSRSLPRSFLLPL
jgi:hypothetical protein